MATVYFELLVVEVAVSSVLKLLFVDLDCVVLLFDLALVAVTVVVVGIEF